AAPAQLLWLIPSHGKRRKFKLASSRCAAGRSRDLVCCSIHGRRGFPTALPIPVALLGAISGGVDIARSWVIWRSERARSQSTTTALWIMLLFPVSTTWDARNKILWVDASIP